MKEKQKSQKDKNIKDMIKENNHRMEIAKEFNSNKKMNDILGEKLASKRNFPPC